MRNGIYCAASFLTENPVWSADRVNTIGAKS